MLKLSIFLTFYARSSNWGQFTEELKLGFTKTHRVVFAAWEEFLMVVEVCNIIVVFQMSYIWLSIVPNLKKK